MAVSERFQTDTHRFGNYRTFTGASDEVLAGAPQNLRIAGRIMAMRRMGKASFFHLQDRRGRLQIYIQQNSVGEEVYGLFRTLDVGDIVGVSGHLFRTRTKELTLEANKLAAAGEMFATVAGEMARLGRCRSALSPALSRSDGQSRSAPGFRKAFAHCSGCCGIFSKRATFWKSKRR